MELEALAIWGDKVFSPLPLRRRKPRPREEGERERELKNAGDDDGAMQKDGAGRLSFPVFSSCKMGTFPKGRVTFPPQKL